MKKNPLMRLHGFGQSIWLDFLQRGILVSGELQQLIDEDGLRGVTSNPSIFEKVIDGSIDGFGRGTIETGRLIAWLHTGMIQYRLLIIFAVIVLLGAYVAFQAV